MRHTNIGGLGHLRFDQVLDAGKNLGFDGLKRSDLLRALNPKKDEPPDLRVLERLRALDEFLRSRPARPR